MYKAIIIGAGTKYEMFKRQINKDFEVVGIADNDKSKQGANIDGFFVLPVEEGIKLSFDVAIVTPYKGWGDDLVEQLKSLGVDDFRIFRTSELAPFLIDPLFFKDNLSSAEKRILVKNNVETIYLESNSKCNRKCWHCPNSLYDRFSYNISMPLDLLEKVCNELSEIDYSGYIGFSLYNEPLLDENLSRKISVVKKKLPRAHTQVITNGDLLSSTKLQQLESAGLDLLINSIYLNENSSNSWTYENALGAILKKSERINLPVNILTVDNCVSAGAFGKYKDCDVVLNCVNFNLSAVNRGRLLENVIPSVRREVVCSHPYHCITISYNGLVTHCTNCYVEANEHNEYIVGNANDETIFDIFTSEKYTEMRKKILCDVNALPCTGCSSNFTSLMPMLINGPYLPRPRENTYKFEYLVRGF